MGKRIGYIKLGRSMPLDPANWGTVGGDDEPPLLLKDLADRNPDDEFVLVGRNSGEEPSAVGLPANVTNPWTQWKGELSAEVQRLWTEHPKRVSPLPQSIRRGIIAWFDANTTPVMRDLDALIIWLGQHGTSNTFIPPVGSDWSTVTNPQDAFVLYGSYAVRGVNAFRSKDPHAREEIYLIADARNYHKARDVAWPMTHPIIGQYRMTRQAKHERYGMAEQLWPGCEWDVTKGVQSDHVWKSSARYTYDRLEICGIMPWHIDSAFSDDWAGRRRFGLFINEARAYVGESRLKAMQEYVMPLDPDWVHGKWSEDSLAQLGRKITPADASDYYPLIRSVRSTFTTPSSGSGWATTKPWQAFAVGTVCFFHPAYDTQDNILGDAPADLRAWLRVSTPGELAARVRAVNEDENAWRWLVTAQRAHYDKAVAEARHLKTIEERMHA